MDSPVLPDEIWMQESAELPGLFLQQARRSQLKGDASEPTFIRRFNTAIVLSPADALAVGEWLTEHATALLRDRTANRAHE
ncbi:hypothetical protein GCM10007235_32460 [Pseudoxanthomonas indica]|nr:hypothetical protein GCM10007235_32460 [Pseudoxanthomonas indica]